jgi:hypothetical protein
MRKGESIISVALAVFVVVTILTIQRKWQSASLREVAASAEDLILTSIHGQVPNIAGFELVTTFRLNRHFRAGLYRKIPASLLFAAGKFVVYDSNNQLAFKLDTLEGSKDSWTHVYDFAGREGLTPPGGERRAIYSRDLSGDGKPDVMIGQYSGGAHCCTTVTLIELGAAEVRPLGKLDGLDGLPFEGMDLRKIGKEPLWKIVTHRPRQTLCGLHEDAPEVESVYGYAHGQYVDQTSLYGDYLEDELKRDLKQWNNEKLRSLHLLQNIAVGYAETGKKDKGKRFFAMNLSPFVDHIQQLGYDPNGCIDDLDNLLDELEPDSP